MSPDFIRTFSNKSRVFPHELLYLQKRVSGLGIRSVTHMGKMLSFTLSSPESTQWEKKQFNHYYGFALTELSIESREPGHPWAPLKLAGLKEEKSKSWLHWLTYNLGQQVWLLHTLVTAHEKGNDKIIFCHRGVRIRRDLIWCLAHGKFSGVLWDNEEEREQKGRE